MPDYSGENDRRKNSHDLELAIHDLHNKLNNFICIYDLKNENKEKAVEANSKLLEKHDGKLTMLERAMWTGFGALGTLQFILMFMKR